jgi:hypothetical protein
MKTSIAGILCLLLSGINIFFVFIPQPNLTLVMLINAFFGVFGVVFVVLGILGGNAPASENVVEERNRLLVNMDAKQSQIKGLEDKLSKTKDSSVLDLLSLLQQKGRFVDFVMDDVTRYTDAQVGAAARIVHKGCSEVVDQYFELLPVETADEGSTVSVTPQDGETRFRLVGKVTGTPPYQGRLLHRGWRTEKDVVIAPAEIEIS